MTYTVGEVARIAHVSVRTLHHYDQLNLLQPSGRSDAGYRLYTDEDLERLHQILLYKELGFGLEEIHGLMADPNFDRRAALTVTRWRRTWPGRSSRALSVHYCMPQNSVLR